jgi:hypothetical protein
MARTPTNVFLAGSALTGRVTSWTVPTGKHFIGTAFYADGPTNNVTYQVAVNGVNFCLFYAPGSGLGKANPVVFKEGDVITSPSSYVTLSGFLYDN